jgi:hypothetical protein
MCMLLEALKLEAAAEPRTPQQHSARAALDYLHTRFHDLRGDPPPSHRTVSAPYYFA